MNAADWSLLTLPNSNRQYYYNHLTGESRWQLDDARAGGPYDAVNATNTLSPLRTKPNANNVSTRTVLHKYHSNDVLGNKYYRQQHPQHKLKPTQSASAFLTPPRVDQRIPPRVFPKSLPPPQPRRSSSTKSRHRKSHSCVIDAHALNKDHKSTFHNALGFVDNHTDNDTKQDNYNKDYVRVSNEYKQMEPFRYSPHPTTDLHPTCISCKNRSVRLDKVLFPCEHRCLCSICIKSLMPKQCPLCNATIRAIFDLDNAHESYWDWVEEVSRCRCIISTPKSIHISSLRR